MKKLIKIISLTMIAIFMTACPGKSSSNKDNSGTVCVNCGITAANQVSLTSNMTSMINEGVISLSLTADSQQLNQLASFGQNPIFAYQGQSTATGVLNLNYDLVFGACRLPRGQYQIATIAQSGTYSMGVFQFSNVQITGPASMTAAIIDGVILTDGLGNIRGMSAVLLGLTGMPAIQGWGGYPSNGQIPCGDGFGVRF